MRRIIFSLSTIILCTFTFASNISNAIVTEVNIGDYTTGGCPAGDYVFFSVNGGGTGKNFGFQLDNTNLKCKAWLALILVAKQNMTPISIQGSGSNIWTSWERVIYMYE
jgi:hypothetical protein